MDESIERESRERDVERDTILPMYLPPTHKEQETISWFDACSEDDDDDSNPTNTLLGGGGSQKNLLDKKTEQQPLTTYMIYAASTPGVFSFFICMAAVAFDTPLFVPAVFAVVVLVSSIAILYKLCQDQWFLKRLIIVSIFSLCVFTSTGFVLGKQMSTLRQYMGCTTYANLNPTSKPPPGKGLYSFSSTTHIDVHHIIPFSNRMKKGYNADKSGSCLAPIVDTALASGHTVSYWAVNYGSCCRKADAATSCWPSGPYWLGIYTGLVTESNAVMPFDKQKGLLVPDNAVLVRILPLGYKRKIGIHMALYAGIPFLVMLSIPCFVSGKVSHDHRDSSSVENV